MRTLALEKIIEKRRYLLDRIAHRIEQMRKNEIDAETLQYIIEPINQNLKVIWIV